MYISLPLKIPVNMTAATGLSPKVPFRMNCRNGPNIVSLATALKGLKIYQILNRLQATFDSITYLKNSTSPNQSTQTRTKSCHLKLYQNIYFLFDKMLDFKVFSKPYQCSNRNKRLPELNLRHV